MDDRGQEGGSAIHQTSLIGRPDCNIFFISDVIARDTIWKSLEGGGGVFQTDDVGQGEGGV